MKIFCLLLFLIYGASALGKLDKHTINLKNGKPFVLRLEKNFAISVAAEGLKRPRFFSTAPDDRVFVTDMYDKTDNSKGSIYILDKFNINTYRFESTTKYLTKLRNPNSIAFARDEKGVDYLYIALTDKLVRYKYIKGETSPSSAPETITTFPDSGLSYKYGGWHLTRTVCIVNKKLFVSVGSSCNICEEKDQIRASIIEMNLDGSSRKIIAMGLRNAVGLRNIDGKLVVTNQGSDHLGDNTPDETVYSITTGKNYGWPYYHSHNGKIFSDNTIKTGKRPKEGSIPAPIAFFPSHSSALGLEKISFSDGSKLSLVALHGGAKKSLKRGYKLVANSEGFTKGFSDFLVGFMQNGNVHGRPCDVFAFGKDGMLVSDDHKGVIYYIWKK